jgi:hypothetical protein
MMMKNKLIVVSFEIHKFGVGYMTRPLSNRRDGAISPT